MHCRPIPLLASLVAASLLMVPVIGHAGIGSTPLVRRAAALVHASPAAAPSGGEAVRPLATSATPPPAPAPAPLPAATSGQTPTLRDVVRATYQLVLERDAPDSEVDGGVAYMQNPNTTVKQLVALLATSQEHYDRFVAGHTSRQVAAVLYRHVHGREALGYEIDGWAPQVADGQKASADAMAVGLQAETYYTLNAGNHAVPGHPVTAWDVRRAMLVLEPRSGFADSDRGRCLTVAVAGGAYECGDLRLAHALPAYRTMNKVRQPVLLYNSQHAHPMPIMEARVTLPASRGRPQSVKAVLSVGQHWDPLVERARRDWVDTGGFVSTGTTPDGWTPGQPQMIALSFNASNDPEGAYFYSIEVTATYPDGPAETQVLRGEFPLVNRRDSPFGAGWWLAGLERLIPTDFGAMMWVGGDGSTRFYEALADQPGVWVGRTLDRGLDTLRAVSNYTGASYVRRVPGGARVYFDAGGRHFATVNRLNHHTRFVYDLSGRLTNLHVPTDVGPSLSTRSYAFTYGAGGPNGRLYTVTAPDDVNPTGRTVSLYPQNGDSRVFYITDPDGRYVEFAYWEPGRPEVINRRTDRRRRSWGGHYTYGVGGRLEKVNMDMGVDGEADDLITRFKPGETRALAGTPVGMGLIGSPITPSLAYTTLDGPRNDVNDQTYLWLDRFGSPWRIVAPGQRETVLTHSDLRFPGLVTRMDGPVRGNGQRQTVSASYNERGSVVAQTDWSTSRSIAGVTTFATTRYEYKTDGVAWTEQNDYLRDLVTRVTVPEGEVTRMDYAENGNRLWQQPGDDQTRRVTFQYHSAGVQTGMVSSVTQPAVAGVPDAIERFEYDGKGNLKFTYTPKGYRTEYVNDQFGRTYQVKTPIDSTRVQTSTTTFEPNSNRVSMVETFGPAMNNAGPQHLWVKNQYDEEGNVLSVERWSDPDAAGVNRITTRFSYDAAGRKVEEIAPDLKIDSTFYDPAGNVVRVRTRRHLEIAATPGNTPETSYITMEYDVRNRLTKRVIPSVYYPRDAISGTPSHMHHFDDELGPFPRYPNDGTGYRIQGDIVRFEYDDATGVMRALNRDAEVTRTFTLTGRLESEVQRIATLSGGDFSQHEYRVEYEYDLNGRRTGVRHPGQLGPGGAGNDWTRYQFDALGQLEQVTDALGNLITFGYDERGTMRDLSRPGGLREHFDYDEGGQLRTNYVTGAGGAGYMRYSGFNYDERGKLLLTANSVGTRDTLTALYSGLGQVVSGSSVSHGMDPAAHDVRFYSAETFTMDAMSNQVTTTSAGSTTNSTSAGPLTDNHSGGSTYRYHMGTGRLRAMRDQSGTDTLIYDAMGNSRSLGTSAVGQDRYSYYGADGQLRATDQRSSAGEGQRYQSTFEEYRYDALGRRVFVYARRYCISDSWTPECNLDKVRRTVWDGGQELYEIQVPASQAEADGALAAMPMDQTQSSIAIDPNPYFGRVGYTQGPMVDQPLGILRIGYVDRTNNSGVEVGPRYVNPFAIFPLWTTRGQAEMGTYANGAITLCESATRCVKAMWPGLFFVLERPHVRNNAWHGTVLEDKRDEAGTYYRRNRYYDPATGRFTQEDPIGLAGGLNLYGFANGDPVSYGDPLGLAVCSKSGIMRRGIERAVNGNISWDSNGCVTSMSQVRFRGGNEWAPIRAVFTALVERMDTFTVVRGNSEECVQKGCTGNMPPDRTFTIYDQDWDRIDGATGDFERGYSYAGCGFGNPLRPPTMALGALIIHELLWHGQGPLNGRLTPDDQTYSFKLENIYNRAHGRRERCGH